jgi:hypothetical protein
MQASGMWLQQSFSLAQDVVVLLYVYAIRQRDEFYKGREKLQGETDKDFKFYT